MPIHDLGFRKWEGERSSAAVRWWVIAQTGVRLAWKSSWVRRMLFFAWMPTLVWATGFFLYEQALDQSPEYVQSFANLFELVDAGSGEFRPLINELRTDAEAARHTFWAALLMVFFRSPQAILMVMLVGLIAPPLISKDVRSRAFLIYFSRPLRPFEYVLGKASVVWTYLLMISGLPAFALYLLATLLSPELSLVGQTWDLPLRILAATVVLLIPTTAVALCFSSMTSESRYAGFAWFAVWILGWVSYAILSTRDAASNYAQADVYVQADQFTQEDGFAQVEGVPVGVPVTSDRWILLSPYMTLGEVQKWIFGFKGSFMDVFPEALAILVVTAVALVVLMRRVSAPMRI